METLKDKWKVLGNVLNNEASEEQLNDLKRWEEASEKHHTELRLVQKIWQKTELFFNLKKHNIDNGWQTVNKAVSTGHLRLKRERAVRILWQVAAVFILAIATSVVFYYTLSENNTVLQSEYASSGQVIENVTLPDGTMVALNRNTKITYPEKFEKATREVSMRGEAFFDVSHNPQKPFIIKAGDVQIKVLGTSFNVKTDPEEEVVEVVVKSGRVSLAEANNTDLEKSILLSPGEKGVYSYRDRKFRRSRNSDINYLAWKDRTLVFRGTPLSEVINKIEEVYNINVILGERELEDLRLTAVFEDQPISYVLKVIQITFELKAENKNGDYVLNRLKTN